MSIFPTGAETCAVILITVCRIGFLMRKTGGEGCLTVVAGLRERRVRSGYSRN